MIYFPDTILQRYTYTSTGTGAYGEPKKEYEYADDILVDFQNDNNQELAQQYGVELENLYKIYLDINVTLNDNDKLEDADGNRYHIIGNVMKYKHFHNYQKANLVLERRTSYGSKNDNTG